MKLSNPKRKIGSFFLLLKNNDGQVTIDNELKGLFSYIAELNGAKKSFDLINDRFCFIDSYDFDSKNDIMKIVFKSAKHSYRAPLINKKTIQERDNPKTIDEGESHKTHLAIRFVEGDAIVYLETYQSALTLKQITDYLNNFVNLYRSFSKCEVNYHYSFALIPRDDFREVLNNMNRVVCANLYIEKQLLGGDALNFSERVDEVQEEIIVQVKAKRNRNISTTVNDFLAKLNGGKDKVKRIRVIGRNESNYETVIDTSFIVKREYVDVQLNKETGEVNSSFMFQQLYALAL